MPTTGSRSLTNGRKMLELAWFILCSYGLTYLVVYASIFNSIRPAKEWLYGFGKLFHCPLCFGFHAGWFLFLLSPNTELFSFDQTITNFFICGWTSAGTSYLLSMLVNDEGLRFSHKSIDNKGDKK
jgi:hypothetical protein